MTAGVEEIREAALMLGERDRAELARELLASLEAGHESLPHGWDDEIQRRLDDVREGRVETIPWDVVKQELRARRASRSA
ncbi:addiction module protein [Tessaracoccus caeni]|uniref:addiction module protein n=1 Tax=Tessaracoccus caeni TaxID=3031239 RepID=UPI0023DAB361|nr:addiction module protein [Tessaracoccus caeni]MDF1489258.1 addiction module protein [Tessaracoccus caeni]